jgi:hypothetical protein
MPGRKAPTFVVLGQYDAMSLKEAREKAPEALRALARGEDPRETERKKARDRIAAPPHPSLSPKMGDRVAEA